MATLKYLNNYVLLLTVCGVGLLTNLTALQNSHSWPQTAAPVASAPMSAANPAESETQTIDRAVAQIQQAPMQPRTLNVAGETNAAGYEYHVTAYLDADQYVRQVNYSKFALHGDYILDLEEYYDTMGVLIYLQYSGLGNHGICTAEVEIHGTIYFKDARPIKNISYESIFRTERMVLSTTTLEPDEYHVTLQHLQHALAAQLAPLFTRAPSAPTGLAANQQRAYEAFLALLAHAEPQIANKNG
jgi:hypothetical protein